MHLYNAEDPHRREAGQQRGTDIEVLLAVHGVLLRYKGGRDRVEQGHFSRDSGRTGVKGEGC